MRKAADVFYMNGIRGRILRDRNVLYGLAALGVALVAVAAIHDWRRADGLTAVSNRKTMPPVVFRLMDGGEWRLGEHRGEVVVVNYWASWCGPCWTETPGLVRLAQEDAPRGLAVVGVPVDESDEKKVRAFVERMGVTYPVAAAQPMSQVAYGLDEIPTTILLDREGRVAKVYSGAVKERDLRSDVEVLLREQ